MGNIWIVLLNWGIVEFEIGFSSKHSMNDFLLHIYKYFSTIPARQQALAYFPNSGVSLYKLLPEEGQIPTDIDALAFTIT